MTRDEHKYFECAMVMFFDCQTLACAVCFSVSAVAEAKAFQNCSLHKLNLDVLNQNS